MQEIKHEIDLALGHCTSAVFGFTVTSEMVSDWFNDITGRMPTESELKEVTGLMDYNLQCRKYKYGYTEWDVFDEAFSIISDKFMNQNR